MAKKKKEKEQCRPECFYCSSFLAGAGIFLYPTISDMWNQYRNAQLISDYDQAVTGLSDDNYEKLWKEAEEYNAEHTVNAIVDAFDDEEDYEPTHPYDEVLDPNGDGLMGSIEIPKIQAKLAIYHGLSKNVLEKVWAMWRAPVFRLEARAHMPCWRHTVDFLMQSFYRS